jgi:hypothetical protein
MDKYLTTATFRDPGNMDLKTFHDIVTLDDLWLWHHEVLTIFQSPQPNSSIQTQIPEAQWDNAMLVSNVYSRE